ncbi:MAG: sugar kinase, partial [Pelagibacterales bacterium]|nr:sugar kinase [Pelagibacterales bacterium]
VNDQNKVIGCASDGDIRSNLINGVALTDQIDLCVNKNFVHCFEDTHRENIIKLFDSNVNAIPQLNKKNELITVLTPKDFPLNEEQNIIARAKSPVRISFGGGGSDLTHYFTKSSGGAVINSTISLYSHATLIKNPNDEIIIISEDLNETLRAKDLKLALKQKHKMGLIMSIIELINPKFGFKLHISSDFPVGSGLGGSAVVMSAIIGCFNEFRIDKWSKYEIAEMAYQAERLSFKISGGWQDQYATVFGGINFMEFKKKNNLIHPLKIDDEVILELKENLVLCDTCSTHDSSNIHDDQKKQLTDRETINKLVALNVKLTYDIRDSLLKGDLTKIGKFLDTAWNYKRKFSNKISNKRLDNIYNIALKNGAIGGKLLGAGGGGFFIFYCDPTKINDLSEKLKLLQTKIINFDFVSIGLKSWKVRK